MVIPLFAGAFLGHRYYTRHSLNQSEDQESSGLMNDMPERKHPPLQATDLPWWNWRRWFGEDEATSYLPLGERRLYSHRRERERNE